MQARSSRSSCRNILRRSRSVSISGIDVSRSTLFAFEVRLALFAKRAHAFAMVFALDQDTLRERFKHSPRAEVAIDRVPQDSFRKSKRFRRARQQMFSE